MDLHTSPLVCSFRSLLLNITLVALCVVGAAAQNSPPVITVAPTNQWVPVTATAVLNVQASGAAPLRYQWQFNGADLPGADAATLTVTNMQSAKAGDYVVHVSNDYGSTSASMRLTALQVVAWGATNYGQCVIPRSATNIVAIAAARTRSLALRADGTVVPWGVTFSGYPAQGVTNATSIAAAGDWSMAVLDAPWEASNAQPWYGSNVQVWGSSPLSIPQMSYKSPYNVVAASAGASHSLVLQGGNVVRSYGLYGEVGVPSGLGEVTAVAAGDAHDVVLRKNGTVAVWGNNDYDQTNVPAGLENVIAIAAGTHHTVALKSNGEVVAWGRNQLGQTNVPAGLQDVVTIAAGFDNSMALTAAGQVHVWGSNSSGQTNVPFGLTNVVAMACGADHCMALMSESGFELVREARNQVAGPSEMASFRPDVVGIPPLSYQWQREGTNITGATSPYLVFTNAQMGDEGWYRLIVSNRTGFLVTSNYYLNVLDWPEAVNATGMVWTTRGPLQWRPTASLLCPDGAAIGLIPTNGAGFSDCILQTTVSGPGRFSFRWKSSRHMLGFFVDGAGKGSQGTPERIVVDLPRGNHVLTWKASQSGTVAPLGWSLIDAVSFVPGVSPPVVTNSADRVIAAGTTVQLGVSPSGTPPFQYQWFFNGSAIPWGTNGTLSLTNVQAEHAGLYTVTAANETGISASADTRVTVTPSSPTIATHPASVQVLSGTSNYLAVVATGTDPLACQWTRDGTPIPGATGPVLVFDPAQAQDAGTYAVQVSNANGTASSSNATVTVFTVADQNASGGTAGLTFISAGNAPWYPQTNVTHDGISALQSGTILNLQESIVESSITGPAMLSFWWKVNCNQWFSSLSFRIDGVQQSAIQGIVDWQQMNYQIGPGNHSVQWVFARNIIGGSVNDGGWLDEVSVTQGATPAAIVSSLIDKTNAAGTTLSLSVAASGTPPLAYRWKFNGVEIPGATNATFSVANVQAAASGVYTVDVHNDYGPEVSSSATVTVTPGKPILTQLPVSMARPLHGSALLQASVAGPEPFVYTWLCNGSAVQTTSAPELLITDLQPSHAGDYQLVVRNDYGAVTSAVARLVVHRAVVLDLWQSGPAKPQRLEDMGDVIAVAAGRLHTSALRSDGTVISWGDNTYGQTNVPPGLSNVVAIAAGDHHTLALRADGSLMGWGDNFYGQVLPQGVQPVVAITASWNDSMVLQADGTLLLMGYAPNAVPIPPGLSNVVAISRAYDAGVAVLEDGSLTAWGLPHLVPGPTSNMVHAAVSQSAGFGLRDDGTVHVWAATSDYYSLIQPNAGILALDAESGTGGYALMVYTNGTLSTAPTIVEKRFQTPPGLTNVAAVDAGRDHAVLLLRDGSPFLTRRLLNRTAPAGSRIAFYPGISGSQPMAYQWYHDGIVIPGATNLTLILDQVSATAAGLYHCTATNPLGTVTIPPAKLTVTAPGPNPGLQLALSSQGTAGQVRLQVSGLSGNRQVVIYTSTDLLNWQPVSTNTPITDTVEFIDQTTAATQRFYKAVEQ